MVTLKRVQTLAGRMVDEHNLLGSDVGTHPSGAHEVRLLLRSPHDERRTLTARVLIDPAGSPASARRVLKAAARKLVRTAEKRPDRDDL